MFGNDDFAVFRHDEKRSQQCCFLCTAHWLDRLIYCLFRNGADVFEWVTSVYTTCWSHPKQAHQQLDEDRLNSEQHTASKGVPDVGLWVLRWNVFRRIQGQTGQGGQMKADVSSLLANSFGYSIGGFGYQLSTRDRYTDLTVRGCVSWH